ncbi:Cell Wall Hydrolase [Sphingomonas antarctica]|uniref:cell wall hydrolase n=1 Tax=Sphingomonas antarctica TaxID=2040274 RepID=UPI0039EB14D6
MDRRWLWVGVAVLLLVVAVIVALQRRKSSAPIRVQTVEDVSKPPTPPPAVEPVVNVDISPDDARKLNEAVPFAAGANPPARPYNLSAVGDEREKAITCLAAAGYYEAGDDADRQKSVDQVVLNRVRHPAFPKSICAVVFQGAERSTGCQFTFACDGSLASRQPAAAAWARARTVAEHALQGTVDKRVGLATHYHTDWVMPYWGPTLDKIARVKTHLFFRWKGWWGTQPAFRGGYAGNEPLDPRIAYLAPGLSAEAAATVGPPPVVIPNVSQATLGKNVPRLIDPDRAQYVLQLDKDAFPGSYASTALGICRGKSECTVMGWLKAEQIPRAVPIRPANMQAVSFLYRRRGSLAHDQALWNCRVFKRPDAAQCIPGTGPVGAQTTAMTE